MNDAMTITLLVQASDPSCLPVPLTPSPQPKMRHDACLLRVLLWTVLWCAISTQSDAALAPEDAQQWRTLNAEFDWQQTDESQVRITGKGVEDGDGNLYYVGTKTYANADGVFVDDQNMFVARINADDSLGWTKEFGMNESDGANFIAIMNETLAGETTQYLYVVGWTWGFMDEGGHALNNFGRFGGRDVVLLKLSLAGSKLWARQFGSSVDDLGYGVQRDGVFDTLLLTGTSVADQTNAVVEMDISTQIEPRQQPYSLYETQLMDARARESGASPLTRYQFAASFSRKGDLLDFAMDGGVTLASRRQRIAENSSLVGEYAVVLNRKPLDTVNVTVSLVGIPDPRDNTTIVHQLRFTTTDEPTRTLTFTPVNWNREQLVRVQPIDDAVAEGVHYAVIAHETSSNDPNFNGPNTPFLYGNKVTMHIDDNDVAGIHLSRRHVFVAEGNAGDSYEIVLLSKPWHPVQVTIVSLHHEQSIATPSVVVLEPDSWNVSRSITVIAIDDSISENEYGGLHFGGRLMHYSTSKDRRYHTWRPQCFDVPRCDPEDPSFCLDEDVNEERLRVCDLAAVRCIGRLGNGACVSQEVNEGAMPSRNFGARPLLESDPLDDELAGASLSYTEMHELLLEQVTDVDRVKGNTSYAFQPPPPELRGFVLSFLGLVNLGQALDVHQSYARSLQAVCSGLDRLAIHRWTSEAWPAASFRQVLNATLEMFGGSVQVRHLWQCGLASFRPGTSSINITVWDNDPGVTISTRSLTVRETRDNSSSDSYSIVLNAPPSSTSLELAEPLCSVPQSDYCGLWSDFQALASSIYSLPVTQPLPNISVAIVGSVQLVVSPSIVTFTTADWFIPQHITVRAVDDDVAENGVGHFTITHKVQRSSLGYNNDDTAFWIRGATQSMAELFPRWAKTTEATSIPYNYLPTVIHSPMHKQVNVAVQDDDSAGVIVTELQPQSKVKIRESDDTDDDWVGGAVRSIAFSDVSLSSTSSDGLSTLGAALQSVLVFEANATTFMKFHLPERHPGDTQVDFAFAKVLVFETPFKVINSSSTGSTTSAFETSYQLRVTAVDNEWTRDQVSVGGVIPSPLSFLSESDQSIVVTTLLTTQRSASIDVTPLMQLLLPMRLPVVSLKIEVLSSSSPGALGGSSTSVTTHLCSSLFERELRPALKLVYTAANRLTDGETVQSSSASDASLALNGERGSEPSATLEETEPWWEVTLPELKRLGSLAVFVPDAMASGDATRSPKMLVLVASLVPLSGTPLSLAEASVFGCPHQCPLVQRLPLRKALVITELNVGVRSIRIYLEGTGVLMLREVEAYDSYIALASTANGAGLRARLKSDWNGRVQSDSWRLLQSIRQSDDENAARGMPTRQSSTDPPQAVSSLAVDGQVKTLWDSLAFSSVQNDTAIAGSTRTEAQKDPWFEVDLGEITPISQVVLYPYIGASGRSFCKSASAVSSFPAWAGDLSTYSKTDELLQLEDPFEQVFEVVLSDSPLASGGTTVAQMTLSFSCAGGVSSVSWDEVFAKARYVTVTRPGDSVVLMLNEVIVTRWNPSTTPQYVLLDLRGSGDLPLALSSIQLYAPSDESESSYSLPLDYSIHSVSSQRAASGDGSAAALISASTIDCYVADQTSYREWIVLKLATKPTRVGLVDIQTNVDKCGTGVSRVLAVSVSVLGVPLDGQRSPAIEATLSTTTDPACSLTASGKLASPSAASSSCSAFVCDHASCRAATMTTDSIVFADFNDVVAMGIPPLTPNTRLPLSQHEARAMVLRDNPVSLWTFDSEPRVVVSSSRMTSVYSLTTVSASKMLDVDDTLEQSFFSNAVAVQPAMSAFTIELWILLTAALSTTASTSMITLVGGASTTALADISWTTKNPNGVFTVRSGDTGATCSIQLASSPVMFNVTERWYHIAASYDPRNARIGLAVRYMADDDVLAVSASTACNLPFLSASGKSLQLGAFKSTSGFVGRVANVAWYVDVLTDRQALDHIHDFFVRGSRSPLHNSYAVRLASKPSTPVTVEVKAETACYYFALCNVTAMPRTLEFTPETWNVSQYVRVIGTDDQLYEGLHRTVVVHRASSRASYEKQSMVTTEDLADQDVGKWRDYKAARAAYDNAAVFDTATTADIDAAKLVLDEIHANWSTQNVSETFVVRHLYTEALVIRNVTIEIEDATVPGIQFSTTSLVVSESGRGNDYQILLLSEPKNDVYVVLDTKSDCYRDCFPNPVCPSMITTMIGDLACGDGASLPKLCNITVSPEVLVFTPVNWSYPQTVRVLAVDDLLDEANVHMTTIKTTSKSLDPIYDALFLPDIVVAVEDNDDTAIDYSVLTVTLDESLAIGTSYDLALTTEPWANVTIAMSNEADGSCYRPCGYPFDKKDCGLPRQQSVSSIKLATDSPREIHEIRLALPRPRVMEVQRLATFSDHVDHVYSVHVSNAFGLEVQAIEFAFNSAFKSRFTSASAVTSATTYMRSFRVGVTGRATQTPALDGFATAAQVETALNSMLVGRSPGMDTSQAVQVSRTLLYDASILRWQVTFLRFVAADLSFPLLTVTADAPFEGVLSTTRVTPMTLPTGSLALNYGGEIAEISLSASENDVEATLRDSSVVYTVSVSRAIEITAATSAYALIYGITFTSVERYDSLTANPTKLVGPSGSPATIEVKETQQPVKIDGMFIVRYDSPYVNASANISLTETGPIPWNAPPEQLAGELTQLDGVGSVTVVRRALSPEGAMDWTVAFVENNGDLPMLQIESINLTGKGVYTEVTSVIDGVSLGGVFTVEMGGELMKTHAISKRVYVVSTELRNTTLLDFNISADALATELAALGVTEQPNVVREGVDCDAFDVCEGYTWTIHYVNSAGNLPPIQVYGTNDSLTGRGAAIEAKTVANGTYLSGYFSLTLELDDVETNTTHRGTTWNLAVNVSALGMDEALEAIRFVRSNREAEFDPETRVSRGWQFDKGVRVVREGPYLDGGHTWRLEWAIEDYVRFQDLRISIDTSLVTQLIEPFAVPSRLDLSNKPRCDAIPHARFELDESDPFQLRGFCVYDIVNVTAQERFLCNYTVENPWIVFTPESWCQPQSVQLMAVDDFIDEATIQNGNTTYSNVTHTVFSDDLIYSALPLEHIVVAVENDDVARVVVSETHLDVSEDGAVTASYELSLTTEPLYDVKIVVLPWLDNTDTKCYRFDLCNVTFDVDTFLFTPRDWNMPQQVLVRATDDDLDEYDTHDTGISHKSYSDDLKYHQLPDIPKIHVTVADNDDSAFFVNKASVNVTEGDDEGELYEVVLRSEPFAKVTVSIQNIGEKGHFATTNPTQLVFTWRNWNVTQTVRVTAVDDDTDDPDDSTSVLVHSIRTNDLIYAQLKDLTSVKVWIEDNDESGIDLLTNSMDVQERAAPYSYAVRLTSEPWFPVVVTPNADHDCYIREATQDHVCNVTLTTMALYFGPANWSQWQSVVFNAFDDALEETPVHMARITHSSTSKDPLYIVPEYADQELQLAIEDNDVSFVDISLAVPNTATRSRLHVAEGGFNDTYTIVLKSEPYEDVLVTVRPSVDHIISIDQSIPSIDAAQVGAAVKSQNTKATGFFTLLFTPLDWSTPRTVTVFAIDDTIPEDPTQNSAIFHESESADPKYNISNSSIGIVDMPVLISDRETTPPPLPVSALFDSTGARIIITFDSIVYHAATMDVRAGATASAYVARLKSFACSLVFSSSLTALGTGATCSWSLDLTRLRIDLGTAATIVPGNMLLLYECSTFVKQICQSTNVLRARHTSRAYTQATITVRVNPSDVVRPRVILNVPERVGSCGSWSADASLSTGSAGRPFTEQVWFALPHAAVAQVAVTTDVWYSRSLVLYEVMATPCVNYEQRTTFQASNLAPDLQVFIESLEQLKRACYLRSIALEGTTKRALRLQFNSSQLVPDTKYVVGISLVNAFSQQGIAVQTVNIGKLPSPVVVAVGEAALHISRGESHLPVMLQGDATLDCLQLWGANAQMAFRWFASMYSTDAGPSTSAAIDLNATNIAKDPRVFRASRTHFQAGKTYLLRLDATATLVSGQTATGSVTFTVNVVSSELHAVLRGGDRAIGERDMLVLNASQSIDPDNSSQTMQYVWKCEDWTNETLSVQPCLNASSPSFATIRLPAVGSSILSIEPFTFQPKRTLRFILTLSKTNEVTKQTRSATAQTTLWTQSGSIPSVTIVASATKINPSSRLTITATVTSTYPATGRWLEDEGDLNLPDATSNVTTHEAFSLPLTSSSIAILRNTLTPGQRYVLRYGATDVNGNAGYGIVSFVVNAPPSPGTFQVSPRVGDAVIDQFTLACLQWTDDGSDLPLRYAFGVLPSAVFLQLQMNETRIRQRMLPLVAEQLPPSATVTMLPPEGLVDEAEVTVIAFIVDVMGSSAMAYDTIVVRMPEAATSQPVPFVSSLLSRSVDVRELFSAALIMQRAMVASSGDATKCPSTADGVCGGHGVCNLATSKCVCDTGFMGPICQFELDTIRDLNDKILSSLGDSSVQSVEPSALGLSQQVKVFGTVMDSSAAAIDDDALGQITSLSSSTAGNALVLQDPTQFLESTGSSLIGSLSSVLTIRSSLPTIDEGDTRRRLTTDNDTTTKDCESSKEDAATRASFLQLLRSLQSLATIASKQLLPDEAPAQLTSGDITMLSGAGGSVASGGSGLSVSLTSVASECLGGSDNLFVNVFQLPATSHSACTLHDATPVSRSTVITVHNRAAVITASTTGAVDLLSLAGSSLCVVQASAKAAASGKPLRRRLAGGEGSKWTPLVALSIPHARELTGLEQRNFSTSCRSWNAATSTWESDVCFKDDAQSSATSTVCYCGEIASPLEVLVSLEERLDFYALNKDLYRDDNPSVVGSIALVILLGLFVMGGQVGQRLDTKDDKREKDKTIKSLNRSKLAELQDRAASNTTVKEEFAAFMANRESEKAKAVAAEASLEATAPVVTAMTDAEVEAVEIPNETRVLFGSSVSLQMQYTIVTRVIQAGNALLVVVGVIAIAVGLDFWLVLANTTASALVLVLYGQPIGLVSVAYGGALLLSGAWGLWLTRRSSESSATLVRSAYGALLLLGLLGQIFFLLLTFRYIDDLAELPTPALIYLQSVWDALSTSRREEPQSVYGCCGLTSIADATACPEEAFDVTPPRTCLRVIQAEAKSLFDVSYVYLEVLVLLQVAVVAVLRALRRWRRQRLLELANDSTSSWLVLRGSSIDVALLCLTPALMDVMLGFITIVLFYGIDLLAGLHVLSNMVVTTLLGFELGVAVVILTSALAVSLLLGRRALHTLDSRKAQIFSATLSVLLLSTIALLAVVESLRDHWLLDPSVVNLVRRRYLSLPRDSLVDLELVLDCCGFDSADQGACESSSDSSVATCHGVVLRVLHQVLLTVSHRLIGLIAMEALLLLLSAVINLRSTRWATLHSGRRVLPLAVSVPRSFSESLLKHASLAVLSLGSAVALAVGVVVLGAGLDALYELNILHLSYLLRVFDRHVATYLLSSGGAIIAFGGLGLGVAWAQRRWLAWIFVAVSALLFFAGLTAAGYSHRYANAPLNDAALSERLESLWTSTGPKTTRVFLQNAMGCCGFERRERVNGTVVFTDPGERSAWHSSSTSINAEVASSTSRRRLSLSLRTPRRLTQTICPLDADDGCVRPLKSYVKSVARRGFQLSVALVASTTIMVAALAGLLWRQTISPPLPWAIGIARVVFCMLSGGLVAASLASLALGIDVVSQWSLFSSTMFQLVFPRSIGVTFFVHFVFMAGLNTYAVQGAVSRTVHRVFIQAVTRVVVILVLLLCVGLAAYGSNASDLRGYLSRQWDTLSSKTQHRISLEHACCGYDDPTVIKGKGLVFDRPAVGYTCALAAGRGCRKAMEAQLQSSFNWLFQWVVSLTAVEVVALASSLLLLRGLKQQQPVAWFAIESRLRFASGRYKRELRRSHLLLSVASHYDHKYTRGQRLMSVLCGLATSLAVYAAWFARHGCHRHALKTCVQPDAWGFLGMGLLYGGCVGFGAQLVARALFESVRNRSDEETAEVAVTRQRKEKALLFRGLFGRRKATTPVSSTSLLEPPVHSTTEERWYAWLSRFVHAVYAILGLLLFLFGCGLAVVMALVVLGWQRTLYGVTIAQGPKELLGLAVMIACAALLAWLALDRKQRGGRSAVLFVLVALAAAFLIVALGLAVFMASQALDEDDSNWTIRNTGFSVPKRLQDAWNADVSGYFRSRVQQELQCCGFKNARDGAMRPCPQGKTVKVDYEAVRVDGTVVTESKDEVRDLSGCYNAMLERFHSVVDTLAYIVIGVGAALVLLAASALFLAREVVISKDAKLKLRVPSADIRETFEKVVGLKIAAPARGKILSKMLSTSLETVAPHVATELAAEPLRPITLPNGQVVSSSLTKNRWGVEEASHKSVPFPSWVASAALWVSFVWVAAMGYLVVVRSLDLGVGTGWYCVGSWLVGAVFHLGIMEPIAVLLKLLWATLGEWWAASSLARLLLRIRSARVSAEQGFYASLSLYEKIRYNAAVRVQRRLLTRLQRRRFLHRVRENREREHQQRVALRRVRLQQAIEGFSAEEIDAFGLLFRDADTAQLGLVPSQVIAQAVYQLGVSVDAALVHEFLLELDPAYADLVDLEHFLYGMHCVRMHHQAQQQEVERTRSQAADEREAAKIAAAEQLVSSSTRFGPRADPHARVVVKRQNLLRELREKRESLSYRLLSKVSKLPPLSRSTTATDDVTSVAVTEEEAPPTGAYVLLQNRKLSPKKRALEMVLKKKSREEKESSSKPSSPRRLVIPTLRLPGSPRKQKAAAVSAAEATSFDAIPEENEGAEASSPSKVDAIAATNLDEADKTTKTPLSNATADGKPFGTFMLMAKQSGYDGKAKVLEKLQAAKASGVESDETTDSIEDDGSTSRPSTAEKRDRANTIAKSSLEKALKKKAQAAKPPTMR